MGAEVHPCPIPPAEERLASLGLARDEVFGGSHTFIIDGLHTLLGQRSKILNGLTALSVRFTLQHASASERACNFIIT